MATLPEVCEAIGLKMKFADYVGYGQVDGQGNQWPHYQWTITLQRGNAVIAIPWRAGLAHIDPRTKKPRPPIVADVVHSLCIDAQGVEATFEEWCGEFGYNTGSRKNLDLYLKCQAIAVQLRKFLGSHYAAISEAAQEY